MLNIIFSTKGGCGKTFFALQCLYPYLKEKHGKAIFIEFDEANFSVHKFNNSKLIDNTTAFSIDSLKKLKDILENLLTDIEMKIIIDVGANVSKQFFDYFQHSLSFLTESIYFPCLGREEEIDSIELYFNKAKSENIEKLYLVLSKYDPRHDLARYPFLPTCFNQEQMIYAYEIESIIDFERYGYLIYDAYTWNKDKIREKIQKAIKEKDMTKVKEYGKQYALCSQSQTFWELQKAELERKII